MGKMRKAKAVLLCLLMAFSLSGCFKPTAEDYYSQPENAEILREIEEDSKGGGFEEDCNIKGINIAINLKDSKGLKIYETSLY